MTAALLVTASPAAPTAHPESEIRSPEEGDTTGVFAGEYLGGNSLSCDLCCQVKRGGPP